MDLKDYRIREHLSQRDVARYCDVSHELIGQVERGKVGVTEYNYAQIVRGINGAIQAIARGTFDSEKEKERQEEKEKAEAKKSEQVTKAPTKQAAKSNRVKK